MNTKINLARIKFGKIMLWFINMIMFKKKFMRNGKWSVNSFENNLYYVVKWREFLSKVLFLTTIIKPNKKRNIYFFNNRF